jgi:AcrR family transcriptional regulator
MEQKPKRRGRPRAYDPDAALMRATETFWRNGYSATSLDMLGAATDMNRPSLYGAFGDKRALYLKALDRYAQQSKLGIDQALDYGRPLAEGLKRFYDMALSLYLPEDGKPRGCFLIGTAVTEAAKDPEIRARLASALHGFDRLVEARFRHAQKQGELDAGADPAALASIAGAVLHTLAIRSRAGDSRASLKRTVDAAVALICGKTPEQRAAGTRTRRK